MVDFWGVALGGGIAIVGSIAVKWWEEYRHRRALRAAFGAEINGILEIANARGHLRNAEEWLARWRRGEDHVPQLFTLDDDKMPEDPVYDKNVDKIGMLGTDAAGAFFVSAGVLCGLLAGAMSLGGRAGYGWPGDGVAGSAGGSLRQFAGSRRLAFLFLPSAPRDERRTRPGR
jgi:hypothetical protein